MIKYKYIKEGLPMPLLSIIVPVYNVEKYLSQCLDSVLCTGLADYEIICVNDGSTDSSPKILEKYAQRWPGILRIVNRPNGGLGAASNSGIENAKGKYITFLDSDDYYAPGAVEEMIRECRDDFEICFFNFENVNDAGAYISTTYGCHRPDGIFSFESYPQLLFEFPSRCNKIFLLELFARYNIRYPSPVWFEDYRTNPKFYPYCTKIKYVNRSWYHYRQQASSITHGTNTQRNIEIIDAAEDLLNYYKTNGLFEKYHDELEYSVFYNELLTSTDRVNLIDCKSPVQAQLLDWYLNTFPAYQNNPYFKTMPAKLKIIHFLISHRMYGALNLLLTANNKIKHK